MEDRSRSLESHMGDDSRAPAVRRWWRALAVGWRVNLGLYALAAVALVALLIELAAGGGESPRRVEVASQARPSTTVATPATTFAPPTTTGGPTTSAVTTTVAEPSTTGKPARSTPTSAAPGGSHTGSASPTTTAPPVCRNSTDPRCGPFRYEPAPAANQPLTVQVVVQFGGAPVPPAVPKAGQEVTFTVTVADPDDRVSAECGAVSYGDGATEPLPCSPPSPCPQAFGPWDPPAPQADSQTFTFKHTYGSAGTFNSSFTFHTILDRCPEPDPYGSLGGSGAVPVNVAPGP
ncbi:MAG: hypothetical protein ABR511_14965 [Acidimicrobiales bacterium]